jgi:hypothetical protein
MALAARQRLGTADEFDATVEARVPHPFFSDAEALDRSEFVERLDDDGCQRALAVLAPHGGAIERHTDRWAGLVAAIRGADRASVWRCRGFQAGGRPAASQAMSVGRSMLDSRREDAEGAETISRRDR